jgi:hypothetical protein
MTTPILCHAWAWRAGDEPDQARKVSPPSVPALGLTLTSELVGSPTPNNHPGRRAYAPLRGGAILQ